MSIVDISIMKQNIEEVVYYQLEKTIKIARQHTQRVFDQNGISITKDQFVLMKTIHDFEPISQVDLAAKALKETASITRMLDLLEKQDMTKRVSIEGDRRRYNIELSEKGRVFMTQHLDMLFALRAKGIEDISDQDLATTMNVLKKIQENLA